MQVINVARPRNGTFAKESKIGKTPVTKLFSAVVDMRPLAQMPSLLLSHHQLASLSRDVTEDTTSFLAVVRSTNFDENVSTFADSVKDQQVSEKNPKIDNKVGLYPLSNAIFDPLNRLSGFNLASLTSDSADIIGCNRPLGLINARANERTRRKSQASFSREQSEAVLLESKAKCAQDKQQKELRDVLSKDNEERRKFWLKALALSFVQMHSSIKVSKQIEDQRVLKIRNSAAQTIQKFYLRFKLKKFSNMFCRFLHANSRFKNTLVLTVSVSWPLFIHDIHILILFWRPLIFRHMRTV